MSFLKIIEEAWDTASSLAGDFYTTAETYASTAYDKVEGFLGLADDGTTAVPGYRPSAFDVTGIYDTRGIAQNIASNSGMANRALESAGVLEAVKPAVEGGLWETIEGGVESARSWYDDFTKTPGGKFVEGVIGYGAGKGQAQYQVPRVQQVRAPGVNTQALARSTPVDLRASFADPRISNAMQKALSSEVPQIRLTLQTISPTRRSRPTVSVGASTVSAPKIRKIKAKTGSIGKSK